MAYPPTVSVPHSVALKQIHGYLLGDPFNGHFPLFTTFDGGETWTRRVATKRAKRRGVPSGRVCGKGRRGCILQQAMNPFTQEHSKHLSATSSPLMLQLGALQPVTQGRSLMKRLSRSSVEMADIVRYAGQAFVERSRRWISGQHEKVLAAITRCRTAALGGIATVLRLWDTRPSLTTRVAIGTARSVGPTPASAGTREQTDHSQPAVPLGADRGKVHAAHWSQYGGSRAANKVSRCTCGTLAGYSYPER